MEIPRYFYIYINFMSWLKINIEKIYFKQSKKSETLTYPYKVLNSVTILRKRFVNMLFAYHTFIQVFIHFKKSTQQFFTYLHSWAIITDPVVKDVISPKELLLLFSNHRCSQAQISQVCFLYI